MDTAATLTLVAVGGAFTTVGGMWVARKVKGSIEIQLHNQKCKSGQSIQRRCIDVMST